jgi:uncharacterized protein YjbI with pentapeptide repeats
MKLAALIFLVLVALPLVVHGADGSDSLPVVQASEILAKIQKGEPVEYDHVVVKGDLDLSQLQTNVTSHIRINDSAFDGFVSFNYTNLDESIDLSGSNFTKDAYFWGATFRGNASFSRATFSGNANFSRATFSGNANFSRATFSGNANFSRATFSGNANFSRATFSGTANFSRATFSGDADFNEVTFSGDAYFNEVTFSGDAYFNEVTFSGNANFMGAAFSGDAYFREATFSGDAYFNGATFIKRAAFYNAQFNTTSFSYTQFDDAFFDGANFRGELSLDRSKYKNMYIKWSNITKLTYDASAYQLLIENFKKLGFLTDADNSYYQFRKEQFQHRSFWEDPLIYTSDLMAGVFYGYGKRPLYPLLWSIAIVMIFGGIWIAVGSKKTKNEVDEYSPIKRWPSNLSDALVFSATVFLSGTKLFVDPPAIPEISGVSRSFIRKAFTIERLLGALFSVLFFLAVTGMIIKST